MTALMNRQTLIPRNTVFFGHYLQTAEGTDTTPIEWLVLDVQEGKTLLLSRYGLDALPYNAIRGNATWEDCTLRSWLNDLFFYRAFTPKEQTGIVTSQVPNGNSQGYAGWKNNKESDTLDKVFLLSYAEANRYLEVERSSRSSSDNPKACVHPTRYAVARGALEDEEYFSTEMETSTGSWWLRSPGSNQRMAANVFIDGNLDLQCVEMDTLCVRPAMWVDLSAGVL